MSKVPAYTERACNLKSRYQYEHAVYYHYWLIVPIKTAKGHWQVVMLDPEGQDLLPPHPRDAYETLEGAIAVGKAALEFMAVESEAGIRW